MKEEEKAKEQVRARDQGHEGQHEDKHMHGQAEGPGQGQEQSRGQWADGICVVKFDLTIGLVIERMTPAGVLQGQDVNAVSMLSFPESNCTDLECVQTFFFRYRRNPSKSTLQTQPTTERQFAYGYSYYVQRKDPTNPRGYFQKALVLLSRYYFCDFYCTLVSLLGSTYFKDENNDFLIVRQPITR